MEFMAVVITWNNFRLILCEKMKMYEVRKNS